MGRPVVTGSDLIVNMLVIPVDYQVERFREVNGVVPSCWLIPEMSAVDSEMPPLAVLFARLPEGHARSGMTEMWMNWTFGDGDPQSLPAIAVAFDTIEDLPLIVADKQWRWDDRELLKYCLEEQGLKQALFADPSSGS